MPATGIAGPSAPAPGNAIPGPRRILMTLLTVDIMPAPAVRLNAQYVTDKRGQRRAIILPVDDYEELLEELEDLAVAAERRDEPAVSHANVVMELKRDGCLPR